MLSAAHTEFTFKPSIYLLINLTILNKLWNLPGQIFPSHTKFQITWIPNEMTQFVLWKFDKHQ